LQLMQRNEQGRCIYSVKGYRYRYFVKVTQKIKSDINERGQ